MSKKIINVGSEPGNAGDGDTLRDAFIKTNDNFNELFLAHYVTDTTLDHDDPGTEGTIAFALAEAGAAGGGTVLVGQGVFKCLSTTLTVPANVILKGVGSTATRINVTGSQDGITLPNQSSGVDSLGVNMPRNSSGDGIKVTASYVTLSNLFFSGLDAQSWAINIDGANITSIENVVMGKRMGLGNADAFAGNGIIFQNTLQASKPFNFGDSRVTSVDMKLGAANTTGIKLHGPDGTDNVINNILLNKVEVLAAVETNGNVGVHLRNAKRIVFNTVDLEETELAIFEEGAGGNVKGSGNNVYMGVFVFGGGTDYMSSGLVKNRLFIGTDNISLEPAGINDVIVPAALWVNDAKSRISQQDPGSISFDEGDTKDGLIFRFNTNNPSIESSSNVSIARVTLGAAGTRGVECLPGLILPLQNNAIPSAVNGTIAQYAAGVVGANAGLYQLRGSSWVFIG